MPKPPISYLDSKRPLLGDAILAEGEVTVEEAIASLERKGYFTARPRPWTLGFRDRGLGHGDYAVLDRFGDSVAAPLGQADAELIIAAVNGYKP